MTKEELIGKVREVAERLGARTLSYKDFVRESGVSRYWLKRHCARWTDLCAAAGIAPYKHHGLTDEEIFIAMRDALDQLDEIGSRQEFARHFRYDLGVISGRWPDWGHALRALVDWALASDPGFRHFDKIERRLVYGPAPRHHFTGGGRGEAGVAIVSPQAGDAEEPHPNPLPHRVPDADIQLADPVPGAGSQVADPLGDAAPPDVAPAPVIGEIIAYRGIVYAPTNEAGVAMMFAVAAEALGFAIESARTVFPDCIALQRIAPGRYRRVRIEFEFASSNFRAHRHDPKGCDLVVCWEHDWPNCPVKVLELRKEIAKARKRA
jgi:hypothetical protein